MSLGGAASFGLFLLIAIGVPALDLLALRALAGGPTRREQGRFLGPRVLGIRVGQMADVMLLLLADLLVVGVLAFVFAGSAYNRAFALFVLAGLGALLALLALRRRRRTAPLSG